MLHINLIWNIRLFAVSLFVAINYLGSFYGCLSLQMSRKQVLIHIPVSVAWGYLLGLLTWPAGNEYIYFAIMIIELGYLMLTVALFAKGSFWCNCVSVLVNSWIVSFISLGLFQILDPQLIKQFYFEIDGYQTISIPKTLFMSFFNLVICFFTRLIILKVLKRDGTWEWLYVTFFIIFVIENAAQGILQLQNYGDYEWFFEKHNAIYLIYVILMVLIIVLVALHSKRAMDFLEEKHLENAIQVTKKQYEESIKKNKEYHVLRHEWNRRANMYKQSVGFVPSNQIEKYLNKNKKDFERLLLMPYSGDMYIDMILERYKKKLEQEGIMIEYRVEAIQGKELFLSDLAQIVEEMFQYICKYEKIQSWCRFSLYRRGSRWICQFEYNQKGKIFYLMRRIRNVIGNNLTLRQNLPSFVIVGRRFDSVILYNTALSGSEFAVMIEL